MSGLRRGRAGSGASLALLCIATFACAGPSLGDLPPAGRTVEGPARNYSLEIPNERWRRAAAEDVAEAEADFQLVRDDGSAWISAWSRTEQRLDAIVWERRAKLLESGVSNYRESRYFLGGPERITASLSRYVAGSDMLLVLVAIQPPYAVELVARGTRASGQEREILAILESVRFRRNDASGGRP